MNKFFYLKLGRGNCLAEYWLKGPNVVDGSAAAIYFRKITAKQIVELSKLSDEEEAKKRFKELTGNQDFKAVKDFIMAGDNAGKTENGEIKFITLLGRNIVYIYEPEDHVFDMPEDKYKEYDNYLSRRGITAEKVRPKSEIENIPKLMPVKNVKKYEVKDVPHVLATLPCNQYYSRGTCREIKKDRDWGVIQAIEYILSGQKIVMPEEDYHKLIELLSPYELETLVFLILKNEGLFVPAWRGGTQKDIDIITRNLTNNEIRISKIIFKPKESKTFQVKKDIRGKTPPKVHADFLVIANSKQKLFRKKKNLDDQWLRFKEEKILDANWLLEHIKKQQETKRWFIESLDWVKDIEMLIENAKAL